MRIHWRFSIQPIAAAVEHETSVTDKIDDQQYLLRDQYHDASNLDARANLHARYSVNPHGFQRWVFDHFLQLPPDAIVLEIGCGPGWLWRQNLARIPSEWQVTLSDFSPGMLAEARRNLADDAQRFSFAQLDAQAIPYPDGAFDAVIANHMLYHVPHRARALAEIRRVLHPHGAFFAVTNGERHLADLHALVAAFDPAYSASENHAFTLENGATQLRAHFAHVTSDRYEDALLVTDAEPLVAYVLSTWNADFSGSQRQAFARFVADRLAAHGPIHIGKDTGIFQAW
jgi:ubiquinone/menaquinone biosynthesis C-methylase UbiE